MTIGPNNIKQVYSAIKEHITKTPLVYAPELSEISGANVYLKMEQMQQTGSFKLRGVLSKVLSLDKSSFTKPFVAASTGNHASAFGYASEKFNFSGILFLPKKVNKEKLKAIEHYDIEKHFYGDSSVETEAEATNYAKKNNAVLIHPYNDIEIIKGQGTVGLEIQEQLPNVDAILVPIGGGGLASGICLYFKDSKNVEIIGCQPKNASEMYDSIEANKIVSPSTFSTIADASAGGIEEGAITFDICKKHLSDFEIIEEEAIKEALTFILKNHKTIIEPASALPVATLMNTKKYSGKNVVLVLTGKKISKSLLKEISKEYVNNH